MGPSVNPVGADTSACLGVCKRLLERHGKLFDRVHIIPIEKAEQSVLPPYRVRAGRFAGRADAGRYAQRLATLGYTVLVTPE